MPTPRAFGRRPDAAEAGGVPTAEGGDELPQVLVRHRRRTLAVSHGATLLALGCVALYALLPGRAVDRGLVLALVGVQAGSAVLVGLLPWPRLFAAGRGEPLLRAWSALSVLLIGAAIAVTGGATSPLYLLYALTTVFFAAAYPARVQVALALASVASYLLAAVAAGTALPANVVVVRVSLFLVISALAAHLSRELGTQLQAHVDARRELERRAEELARTAAENEHLALHDALTGLANRSLFNERAEGAIAAARRRGARSAVLVVDLDGFKDVNDLLGHDTGDELLRQVGPRLRAALRAEDVVARMGGDEFAVLLPQVAGRAAACDVAEKLVRALARPFDLGEATIGVEGSVGVAVFPEHGEDADGLIRHADTAMYAAKEDRSGWALYAPAPNGLSRRRVTLLGELRSALESRQLVLHYQPLVEVADGGLRAFEALVRWQHPQRGLVQPGGFVPLAEQTTLIQPLTLLVLDEALAQAQAWRDEGFDVPVSVNVSMRNLHNGRFPREVETLLARRGLGPSALELEITESAIMTQPRRAAAVLAELDRMGIRLAIDDFGTGHSSLAYLTSLPVRELKIDRTFVRRLAADRQSRVIVRSMVDIGRNLGLVVVGEGVEDEQTWDALVELGCEVAQGYYLSRPAPAAELGPWLVRAGRARRATAG